MNELDVDSFPRRGLAGAACSVLVPFKGRGNQLVPLKLLGQPGPATSPPRDFSSHTETVAGRRCASTSRTHRTDRAERARERTPRAAELPARGHGTVLRTAAQAARLLRCDGSRRVRH